MRTNYAGFAVTVGMGFVVLLLGLLGLSAAGLTDLAPGLAAQEASAPADSVQVVPASYVGTGSALAATDTLTGPNAAVIQAGDALFRNNCSQCHAIRQRVVGPALAGITARRPVSWLTAWVHNPAKVIASGDAYAIKLFEDNGKQQMPSFPQLSDKEVTSILAYVMFQEGTVPGEALPVTRDATVAAR